MPIKFRCSHCQQFLGISRTSAGTVVDCPACGRTVRVPQLDGTVAPLPAAKLNLQDESILQALDQLATLEAPEEGRAPVILERPEPEVVAGLQSSPVVVVTADVPIERSESSRQEFDALSVLETLTPPAERRRDTQPGLLSRRDVFVAAGGALLATPVAWLIGRRSAATASSQIAESRDAATGEADRVRPVPSVAQAPVEDSSTAIHGRISYIGPDHEARPDKGARILALPENRAGESLIAVEGFRAGSSDADLQLARESLRLLGGGYAVADEAGKYELALASSGTYHLLMISRYQPRESRGDLPEDVLKPLSRFFDRPKDLIGQTQFDFSLFRYSGRESAPRDHVFQRT